MKPKPITENPRQIIPFVMIIFNTSPTRIAITDQNKRPFEGERADKVYVLQA